MNKTRIWMLAILYISFFVISCDKEEDPPAINEAEVLIEYLESTDYPYGKYYINTDMASYIVASAVKTGLATQSVYVIDIRSADDFAAGHIEGAVNVPEGGVLSHLENMDLSGYNDVAIVCVTGQTAGWVSTLCNIAGQEKVSSMKWGMCSWNADFADPWKTNIGNGGTLHFDNTLVPNGPVGDLPELNTGMEDPQDILEARLDVTFTEGFGAAAITNQAVLDNKDDYYIVNYWPLADYDDPGHISGAMQYTPGESIALDLDLTTLPTDKTIVVYCYSGQTSANLAGYLRLIGYDAKTLKYGTNGMIYDQMTKSKWTEGAIMGYDYVTD